MNYLNVLMFHFNLYLQSKQKTFSPVWNEIYEDDVAGGVILGFKVFHDNAVGNDDFVANANLPFKDLLDLGQKNKSDLWVRIYLML